MNKTELVDALSKQLGTKKDATMALDAVIETIMKAVSKGDSVSLTGFGVFEKRRRKARMARNPRTGAPVKVAATSVPAFRPGQGFKDVVTGEKSLSSRSRPAAKRPATKRASKPAAKKTTRTRPTAKKTVKRATTTTKKSTRPVARKTVRKAAAPKRRTTTTARRGRR